MCVQPRRVDRRQQTRPSTSFVDNTINLPPRTFLSPEFGIKIEREVPLLLEIPNFLITQCRIGGRKPPCQNPARFVQSFRHNVGLWQTDGRRDRQTDRHTTTAYVALACAPWVRRRVRRWWWYWRGRTGRWWGRQSLVCRRPVERPGRRPHTWWLRCRRSVWQTGRGDDVVDAESDVLGVVECGDAHVARLPRQETAEHLHEQPTHRHRRHHRHSQRGPSHSSDDHPSTQGINYRSCGPCNTEAHSVWEPKWAASNILTQSSRLLWVVKLSTAQVA